MGRFVQASRRVGFARYVIAAWTIPALAVAAPAPRPTVRVEIDVSKIEAFDAGGIEKEVRARTEHILDQRGYFLDNAASDAVVVRIEYVDKKDLEYGIYVDVFDEGTRVQPGEPWIVCKYCNHSMVANEYAKRLPGALDRLEAANVAARESVEDEALGGGMPAAGDEGGTRPGETAEGSGSEPPPSLVLRNAGLGLLIPGGVALGVGVGLVLGGKREVERDAPYDLRERDFRPPGIALTAVGAVAAAAGIGLLVTHAVRTRRNGRASERLTWSPMLGERAGVVLGGRF